MQKSFILLHLLFFGFVFSQNVKVLYKVKFQPQKEKKIIKTEYMLLQIQEDKSYFYPAKKTNDSLEIEEIYLDFSVYKEAKKLFYYGKLNNLSYFFEENVASQWQMLPNSSSTKDNYTTQQAKIKLDGRVWLATYTPDLPITNGPYKFSGLPGLILEIHSEDGEYTFEMISLKKTNKSQFLLPSHKKLTKKQVTRFITNFIKDPAANNVMLKNSYGDTFNYTFEGRNSESYRTFSISFMKMINKYNNPIDGTTYILIY